MVAHTARLCIGVPKHCWLSPGCDDWAFGTKGTVRFLEREPLAIRIFVSPGENRSFVLEIAGTGEAGPRHPNLVLSQMCTDALTATQRLSHMKDEFLATLSHELRTPLHAIQGWTGLLRERRARPEDYERGLETRERNVRLQVQIVNDLFDMSRIISGKIHLEVQPVYLHEIVNNAMEAVRQSADAKSIRIQPILDSRIGLVRADTCASLLELCGHHVETAYNAEHAIGLGGRHRDADLAQDAGR